MFTDVVYSFILFRFHFDCARCSSLLFLYYYIGKGLGYDAGPSSLSETILTDLKTRYKTQKKNIRNELERGFVFVVSGDLMALSL